MLLQDIFSDVLAHTFGLGFIEMVKITTDDKETKIEAMDGDRTVVVYGKLKTPVKELKGTVGLSRMAVLQGYLKFPPFIADTATVSIEQQQRANELVPAEIKFSSPDGHESSYRFMHKDMAEEQIKVPVFKGASWDVVFTPSDENLKDLSYFNSVLGAYEPVFTPKTDNNKLNFYIGSGPTDRATVPVTTGLSGVMKGDKSWPLIQTLSILKLASKGDSCTMSISNTGALKIDIVTATSEYEYVLPARTK